MPLPLLLIGPAIALIGGYGVKKGVDAVSDSRKASDLNRAARGMFEDAKEDLARARRMQGPAGRLGPPEARPVGPATRTRRVAA